MASPSARVLGGRLEHIVTRYSRETRADGGQTPVNVALVELRTEIGALHAVDRVWQCALLALINMINRERGAECAAGIARRWLHPDIAKATIQEHLPVGNAVERDAARETQIVYAGLVREAAGEAQDRIFQDRLD
jgi:hypothetical protein